MPLAPDNLGDAARVSASDGELKIGAGKAAREAAVLYHTPASRVAV
jgi:hypothetical protein